jgi:hypothetical protein
MIDSEILEKLQNASINERIAAIEAILQSLKNDLHKNDASQAETTDSTNRPAFGFMRDTGEILGDIIAPVLPENTWEVLQ